MNSPDYDRDMSAEQLFLTVEQHPVLAVTFIDRSNLCASFIASQWVRNKTLIVEVDTAIADHYQINRVPTLVYFVNHVEQLRIVGQPDEVTHDNVLQASMPRLRIVESAGDV